MIFTFLITIVFIAELIITLTITSALRRLGRNIRNLNLTISYLKPSISEICELIRKISGQMLEGVNLIIERQKDNILTHIARIILGTLFLRRFKKSKAFKLIGKGLSLLEIVV